MSTRKLPSVSYLRECFEYDPNTGVLTWKPRPRKHFQTQHAWAFWNGKYAETEAGCFDPKGYVLVKIDGGAYRVHRIVWKMSTGNEPLQIDHKDRNRANNRLANLRAATNGEQVWNSGRRKNNTSGWRGATWHKGIRMWTAQISANGVRQHLGCFASAEEAAAAYEEVARRLHGEFFVGG